MSEDERDIEIQAKKAVRKSYSGFTPQAMVDPTRITKITSFEKIGDKKFKYLIVEEEERKKIEMKGEVFYDEEDEEWYVKQYSMYSA